MRTADISIYIDVLTITRTSHEVVTWNLNLTTKTAVC